MDIPCLYERKSTLSDSVKDIDRTNRIIVGMFANYQSPDMVGDVSQKGMFDRTWKETKSRVSLLFEHKTEKVISKKLDLWDDTKGAYHKSLIPNTKLGDTALEMAEAGLWNEHSYGFAAVRFRKNEHGGRNLHEVKHFEVTLVGGDWAIHPGTPVLKVKKSLSELISEAEGMEKKYKALKQFCYSSKADDDTLEHLETVRDTLLIEVKQLHQHILDLSSLAANNAPDPQRKGLSPNDVFLLEASIQNQLLKLSN